MSENSNEVPAKQMLCNSYYCEYDRNEYDYTLRWYPDGVFNNGTTEVIELDYPQNLKYVIGDTNSYMSYYIASKSMLNSNFFCGGVYRGWVTNRGFCMCATGSDFANNVGGGPSGWGVRPIVIIPSDIEVQEVSSGVYGIK